MFADGGDQIQKRRDGAERGDELGIDGFGGVTWRRGVQVLTVDAEHGEHDEELEDAGEGSDS